MDGGGLYIDGGGVSHASIHANAIALAFNLMLEERIGKVVDWVESRGMACNVYFSQYLLEALFKTGRDAAALRHKQRPTSEPLLMRHQGDASSSVRHDDAARRTPVATASRLAFGDMSRCVLPARHKAIRLAHRPPHFLGLNLHDSQASTQNIASGVLFIEQIVHHKDALRLASVGVVRKTVRGNDCQVDRLGRLGNSLESVQLVFDVLAIIFRQYVFPSRILHLTDVDDVVGPVDEQIDLRTPAIRFIR